MKKDDFNSKNEIILFISRKVKKHGDHLCFFRELKNEVTAVIIKNVDNIHAEYCSLIINVGFHNCCRSQKEKMALSRIIHRKSREYELYATTGKKDTAACIDDFFSKDVRNMLTTKALPIK